MFCGIGGFRLGLEKASENHRQETSQEFQKRSEGIRGDLPNTSKQCLQRATFSCVWSNDNDRYACQIYRRHFGEVHEADIRTVDADAIPEHDLLCAGFPCQSFSIAGKREGFADIRGTLFQEICRVIGTKRPPYLFLENVKGLLSAPYTEAIEQWQEEDFDTETGEPTTEASKKHRVIPGTKGWVFLTILNALWELGYDCQWDVINSKAYVPQNRERVFIIGHTRGTPRPKVFPLGEADETYTESDAERGEVSPAGQDLQSSNRQAQSTSRNTRFDSPFDEDIATYLDANYWKGWLDHGQRTMIVHNMQPRSPNRPSLRYSSGGSGHLTREDGQTWCLDGGTTNAIEMNNRIRRLTPIECERLQGFPDNWTQGISDSQRYKCLGNAVTVNVIEAIGRQLMEFKQE